MHPQWPAFPPDVLVFVEGNFGQIGDVPARGWPQAYLINAQWLILLLGIVAFVFTETRDKQRGIGQRWKTAGILLVVLAAFFLGWLVYHLPAVSFVPPEQIARQFLTDRIPTPNLTELPSPEQTTLVKRGRLLYTVASCAFCHRPEGYGGLKISWKAFGTLSTRSVTQDRKTGIGAWSDREIARAVRSGVTPDGRTLHWQGMISGRLRRIGTRKTSARSLPICGHCHQCQSKFHRRGLRQATIAISTLFGSSTVIGQAVNRVVGNGTPTTTICF